MSRTGSPTRGCAEGLELEPGELRRRLDPSALPFATTEEVEPLVGTIGQPRALAAIEFGLEAETFGYASPDGAASNGGVLTPAG